LRLVENGQGLAKRAISDAGSPARSLFSFIFLGNRLPDEKIAVGSPESPPIARRLVSMDRHVRRAQERRDYTALEGFDAVEETSPVGVAGAF